MAPPLPRLQAQAFAPTPNAHPPNPLLCRSSPLQNPTSSPSASDAAAGGRSSWGPQGFVRPGGGDGFLAGDGQPLEAERSEEQGAEEEEEAKGARDRVRQGENGRERTQGPEGEGNHEVWLRGWPDSVAPPPSTKGVQEPIQPHLPGDQMFYFPNFFSAIFLLKCNHFGVTFGNYVGRGSSIIDREGD